MTDVRLFDFELPEELIAQYPVKERDSSRLLVINRSTGIVEDRSFSDLPDYLTKGDVIVFNDSKVLKARLFGNKSGTGAKIELLLTKRLYGEGVKAAGLFERWKALARPAKRLRASDEVVFGEEFKARVVDNAGDGFVIVDFIFSGSFMEALNHYGHMPLPPYIRREDKDEDASRYQTIYAKEAGSIAAPTAGLHFTGNLMERIRRKGAETVFITLHVGIGTFQPVKTEIVEEHRMHSEFYYISNETREKINRAKAEGRRVICVGTTSLRCIESAGDRDKTRGWYISEEKAENETNIFIYPGSCDSFMTDGLVTNFHIPRSSLFMLVSAFYDREKMLRVYMDAVKKRYRFFSYGDAMLIV